MAMPSAGSELFDAITVAVEQAHSIQGRKYRYGAILIAGDDHIPLKSGSNKKPFQRDNIHAEMSVLKGCPRPEGKDMLIARLAPARPEKRKGSGADRDDSNLDSEDDGDGSLLLGSSIHCSVSQPAPSDRLAAGGANALGKLLNARPCANCEAKMAARGIRRCFFTLPGGKNLGVLEYNRDPGDRDPR